MPGTMQGRGGQPWSLITDYVSGTPNGGYAQTLRDQVAAAGLGRLGLGDILEDLARGDPVQLLGGDLAREPDARQTHQSQRQAASKDCNGSPTGGIRTPNRTWPIIPAPLLLPTCSTLSASSRVRLTLTITCRPA